MGEEILSDPDEEDKKEDKKPKEWKLHDADVPG